MLSASCVPVAVPSIAHPWDLCLQAGKLRCGEQAGGGDQAGRQRGQRRVYLHLWWNMSLVVYLTLRSMLTVMGCDSPGWETGQAGSVGKRSHGASPALPACREGRSPPGVPGQQEVVTPRGLGLLLGPWGRFGPRGGYGSICRSILPGLEDTVPVARAHHAGARAGGFGCKSWQTKAEEKVWFGLRLGFHPGSAPGE